MPRYVALLRSINVGKRRIKMDALKKAFADIGLPGAQTLIASGNVMFECDKDVPQVTEQIETGLEKIFGFDVPTILRTQTEINAIAQLDPFATYPEDAPLQRYVLFLADLVPDNLEVPFVAKGDFEVIGKTDKDLFVIGHKQPDGRNGPGLDKWVRQFKSGVTNRNWKTLIRLNEMAKS